MSEEEIQRTALQTVKQFYPDLVISVSLNGINLSGMNKQAKYALFQSLKQQHFEKGIPDVLIYLPQGIVLNLEFKRPKLGKQSVDQVKMEKRLTKLGHLYYIVTNTDTVFDLIAHNTSTEYRQSCMDKQLALLNTPTLTKPYLWYPVSTKTSEVVEYLKEKYRLKD